MNLTSLSQVRSLLSDLGVRPNRNLGQNFLIDLNILNILIETARVSGKDRILEIGPGLGVVTERLAAQAQFVRAVEKDAKLHGFLKLFFKDSGNVELAHGDALELDEERLLGSGINKVVSNLPYSVGSRLLVNFAMANARPQQMTVTVQEEVAQRLAAGPDNKNYGPLTVWLQADYEVALGKTISQNCFWPRPDVQSVIVTLSRRAESHVPESARKFFYEFTKACFLHRRKQLTTIFDGLPEKMRLAGPRAAELLAGMNIHPASRPENVSVENWCKLAERWSRDKEE